MKTIEELRRIAELNLCKCCFPKYKALIEPNIKEEIFKPIENWKEVESLVTQMYMKIEGIYKDEIIYISIDKGTIEKYDDKAVELFDKIKRKNFYDKIKRLHKKGILQESSFEFLDKTSKIRNKIEHEPYVTLSEQDKNLFKIANFFTDMIWQATMVNLEEKRSTLFKSKAEEIAKQFLLLVDARYSELVKE